MTPDVALIFCRFFLYGSAMFLWGASAYLSFVVPAGLAMQLSRRLRIWHSISIVLIVAATVFMLPLRAATIGGGWRDAFVPEMLRSILTGTSVGQAWIAQASAVLLLVLSCLAPAHRKGRAVAISAALVLVSMTVSGHAAMNSGWLRTLHRLNDGLHLLSGGAWLGALVPVVILLPTLRDPQWRQDARRALERFSTAGHAAVALVIATGVANTLLVIGSAPLNWQLTYQVLLSIKILIVCALVGLAITNRYVFVPRLARSRSSQPLKWLTASEIALGFAILGLVAVFGTLQPT